MISNRFKDQKQKKDLTGVVLTRFLPETSTSAGHDQYFLKIFNTENPTQCFQVEGTFEM